MKSIEKTNSLEEKKPKMTLRSYYKSLPEANEIAPRKLLIKRVAERCNVPESTARSWIYCGNKPIRNKEHIIAVLAEETDIAPEDMWDD